MTAEKAKTVVRLKSLLSGYAERPSADKKAVGPSDGVGSGSKSGLLGMDNEDEGVISGEEGCSEGYGGRKRGIAVCEVVPDVITLDDDAGHDVSDSTSETATHRASVKSILTGSYRKKRRGAKQQPSERGGAVKYCEQTIEDAHSHIIKSLANTRKVSLRDLFVDKNAAKVSEGSMAAAEHEKGASRRQWRRMHEISKLRELEPPWPSAQLVNDREKCIPKKLELQAARAHERGSPAGFLPLDFTLLNLAKTDITVTTDEIRYLDNYKPLKVAWTEALKPRALEEVLVDEKLKRSVMDWITMAFEKLKRQTGRTALIGKVSQGVSEPPAPLCSPDYSQNYPLEEFVPLMILHGGVGKSTLLDVILQEIGGSIYEVNTSSNRGRKHIWEKVKQFSTTHFVNYTGFHGLIVFDDVDVLFNERDKYFWSAVEKTLLISRRPVILTCRDIEFIPSNLIDIAKYQSSIFHVRNVRSDKIVNYLKDRITSIGIQVPTTLIKKVVLASGKDIRQSITQLQWICSNSGDIKHIENTMPPKPVTLQDSVKNAELSSSIDVMFSVSSIKSLFKDETDSTLYFGGLQGSAQRDEQAMKHDYLVDYRIHLAQTSGFPPMPNELSIARYLMTQIWHDAEKSNLSCNAFYSKVTLESIKFLYSKIKKDRDLGSKRITRSARRSTQMTAFSESTADEEVSSRKLYCDFISTHTRAAICSDFNPYIYLLAKMNRDVRMKNIELFNSTQKTVDPNGNMNTDDIVTIMLERGALHLIYFNRTPYRLLKLWEP